jgi:hypothetical protein
MSVNEFLEKAHELKPAEKYIVIESLIQDLSHIDKEIDDAWIEESERRLKLYDEGKLETVLVEK